MKHCILARFRADAGDWRAYLPEIREIFSAAGDIPGVRGAEVFHNCVDRENRYHVLIRLDMDPAALAAYDVSPMHHRWKDRFGPLLEKKASSSMSMGRPTWMSRLAVSCRPSSSISSSSYSFSPGRRPV